MAKITDAVALDAVEIVIYVLLLPLVVFLAVRHGKTHALAYGHLGLFSILRIVADGLAIANRNSTDTKTIIITQTLGSIGLSPLLLVLAGLAHEAHHYHIKATLSHEEAQHVLGRLRALQGVFHALSAGGMGLIIYAARETANAKNSDDVKKWQDLRKLGVVMIFLAAVSDIAYSIYVWFSVRRSQKSSSLLRLTTFTTCISIGGFFLCIRAVYTVVYTFDKNPDINPITGKFGVKLIFIVAAQLFAVVSMVSGAWITRDIKRTARYGTITGAQRLENDMDSTVPLTYQGSTNYSRQVV